MPPVPEHVQADVDNEMLPLLQNTLNLSAGTKINKQTREHLRHVLPPEVFESTKGWFGTRRKLDAASVQRIHTTLADTRASLLPFLPSANPAANVSALGRPFNAVVRDPTSPAGRSLYAFLEYVNALGMDANDITRIVHVPDTQERAMLRELPRFKTLVREITENREYQDLGSAGEIVSTGTPPTLSVGPNPDTGAPNSGKLGRLVNQILIKRKQIEALRTSPAPAPTPTPTPTPAPAAGGSPTAPVININVSSAPASTGPSTLDTATHTDRIQNEITTLENQILDLETKKTEVQRKLKPLNRSLHTLLGPATSEPWDEDRIEELSIDVESTIEEDLSRQPIEYAGVPSTVSEAIEEDSFLLRRAKWVSKKPPAGTLSVSANALRELIEEYGAQGIRYSDEAELQQFTNEMFARMTSDRPMTATAAAASTGAATTGAAAPAAAVASAPSAPAAPQSKWQKAWNFGTWATGKARSLTNKTAKGVWSFLHPKKNAKAAGKVVSVLTYPLWKPIQLAWNSDFNKKMSKVGSSFIGITRKD